MAYRAMIRAAEAAIEGAVEAAGLAGAAAASAPYSVSPARPGFGDLSCNAAFVLARGAGRRPAEIAEAIAEEYNRAAAAEDAAAAGGSPPRMRASAHRSGYVNLEAEAGALAGSIIRESVREGYGRAEIGRRRPVVVEHTSVNPNKALHIGHVRNVVVGDSVARILSYSGHDVRVLNYIDDSGAQVADVVVGFEHLGLAREPPEGMPFDAYCGDEVYVAVTARYDSDPGLSARRSEVLREIESGGTESARTAEAVTSRVLECQLRTCWSLGAAYDCLNYESQIVRSGMWANAFDAMRAGGIVELEPATAKKNAGCWVFRADDAAATDAKDDAAATDAKDDAAATDAKDDEFSADKVIVRSDGTATYVAKDIPYAAWKLGLVGDPFAYEEYATSDGARQPGRRLVRTVLRKDGPGGGADNRSSGGGTGASPFSGSTSIAVIDSRQSRLQQIVAGIAGGMCPAEGAGGGRDPGEGSGHMHLSYESVTLSASTAASLGLDTGGKAAQMSGRRGLYVSAESILSMLRERASAETLKRNSGLDAGEVGRIADAVAVATVRYEMVKQDLDKVIAFDAAKSLSLEGDTASYIQYAHARAARVLEKAGRAPDLDAADFGRLAGEREMALVRTIGMLDVRVAEASANLSPKVIARYCRDLAVAFNAFYEHVRVIDASDGALTNSRLCLVASFTSALKKALGLIGIDAPPRM